MLYMKEQVPIPRASSLIAKLSIYRLYTSETSCTDRKGTAEDRCTANCKGFLFAHLERAVSEKELCALPCTVFILRPFTYGPLRCPFD